MCAVKSVKGGKETRMNIIKGFMLYIELIKNVMISAYFFN
jgi:hypothetical protein